MKPLLIGECLLPHIARVLEGERPGASLPEHGIFAVFSASTEEGVFCGLATADDIAKHRGWTFADLTHGRQLHSIAPAAEVNQALDLMGKAEIDILPVLGAGNAFAGVVTRQSIQHALFLRVHILLQESQRLNQLVNDERKRMLDWSALLSELHDASCALLSVLSHTSLEADVLQAGIVALAKLLQARYGAIGILDETGGLKDFIYTGIDPELVKRIGHLPSGQGLLGIVTREDVPLRINDMPSDPRSIGFPPHHPLMKTLLAVPIAHGGRVFGRIYLCDKSNEEPFSRDDEVLAQSFAHSLSLVLDNAREMEEIKRAHHKLDYMAHVNALTDLPNRILFSDRLQQAILHAQQHAVLIAVVLVDIDNFKVINNTLGHALGDDLLKMVGQRLGASTKEGDTLAHLGGDEFAMILTGIRESHQIAAICKRILHSMEETFQLSDQHVHITVSIGVTICPQDSSDPPTLFKYGDMAVRRAKDLGRNNIQFFSNEMNERMQERVMLESALRSAVKNDKLQVHYQPLVDLQTGRISGLEALVRWEHPTLGSVSPVRFIPVSEDSGLIMRIGEWILRRVCRDIHCWREHGITSPRVAVNVSPKQFCDPLLADKIEKLLAELQVEPSSLCLEITESVLMQDTAFSVAALGRLKALGFDLTLDDFGTGSSSLSCLKRFPFSKVKIDCSFVQGIITNSEDAAISKAIIFMAQSLGIRVVAEGVETEAQCAYLSQNMCDEIQGFLFSKVLGAEEIEAILREERHLPDYLLRFQKPQRTLLLVDDEANIVAALKRLLRGDKYRILTAKSGQEGLEMLGQYDVDVIVSDQRMPGMTGVEFLRKAKELYPDTVRIVLSGYTELQSVTDAVNEGAIYKFLTKPWDDAKLRGHIEEAFQRKHMADENQRLNLEVRTANQNLAAANRQMKGAISLQQQQITRDEVVLDIVREALQEVPLPVIGLDNDNMVVFVNDATQILFGEASPILGSDLQQFMPKLSHVVNNLVEDERGSVELNGKEFQVISHTMGKGSQSRGKLVILT
ncbi:MAG: EAL domain-containing protein [Burkholderiales bacterium]